LAASSWLASLHASWELQLLACTLELEQRVQAPAAAVEPSSSAAAVEQQSWIAKEPIAVQLRTSLEMAQHMSLEMAQRKSQELAAHTLGQLVEPHRSLEPA